MNPVLLEGNATVSTVAGALTTAFTTGAGDVMDAISGILPVVIPITVAVAVIMIGRKLFKSLAKG